jgi:hypothetical protein
MKNYISKSIENIYSSYTQQQNTVNPCINEQKDFNRYFPKEDMQMVNKKSGRAKAKSKLENMLNIICRDE